MNIKDFIVKTTQKLHRKHGEIIYGIASVLLLWLVMYPEFSITADCCRIVNENGQVIECEMTDRELAIAVLEAEEDEVVIKSKLWELITEWSEVNDNGRSEN